MNYVTEAAWTATSLYYEQPWENFLAKSLKPFAASISQTGIAERYYFERSQETGPHIKLFVRSPSPVMKSVIWPNILEHFCGYFELQPADRKRWSNDGPVSAIRESAYLGEESAYGGLQGLQVAQRHYEASSNEALERMSTKNNKWTQNDAYLAAIEMNLSMTYMLGMDLGEAAAFFEFLWISTACEKQQVRFQTSYAARELAINDLVQLSWTRLSAIGDLSEDVFGRWLQTCLYTGYDFKTLERMGLLNGLPENGLWEVYGQLIEKTNNRLGVEGVIQSFLFYLLHRTLHTLSGRK